MVARGVMYDIRQSRATRKPSDWRGATEISAGRTGVRDLVGWGSWVGDFRANRRVCDVKGY